MGTAIVVVISIPFALFGIGSYLGGGGNNFAAKVNDEEVSIRAYEQNYYTQQNQLRATFGGKIPAGFDGASFLRQQALETSIRQSLLLQHSNDSGYAIGDDTLAAAIYSEAAFQDEGQFSKERYERQLQSQGLVANQFEEQLRQDLSVNQIREGIVSSSFQTGLETQRAISLGNQARTFSTMEFATSAVGTLDAPGEEAIDDYYSTHAIEFQYPEKVKLEYIELNQETLAEKVSVDEDKLHEMYLEQKDKYLLPEQRRASHILIAMSEDASATDEAEKRQLIDDLRQRALAGEPFEELAKEYSEDPGSAEQGGDLGTFQRGAMVPEFEEAAFTLEVDEIGEVVKSAFGFHLIKVTEVIGEQGKSFEQVKMEVEQAFRKRESEYVYFELSGILANEVYENSDTLETASELVGIPVRETEWLETNTADDILRYPAVRKAAFSDELLEEKLNSDVIEVGDNHVLVVRVQEHEPGKAKKLDEVSDEIRHLLEVKNRDDKLKALVDEALAALKEGEMLAQVLGRFDAEPGENMSVMRSDTTVDANIITELFRMPKPTGEPSYSMAKKLDGSYSVIVLSGVAQGESTESQSTGDDRGQVIGRSEYASWLGALRENAEVTINKQLLDDLSAQR